MFHVDKKDLRDFTTTEKDMNKGLSKFPLNSYRVTEGEDLFAQGLFALDAGKRYGQAPSELDRDLERAALHFETGIRAEQEDAFQLISQDHRDDDDVAQSEA